MSDFWQRVGGYQSSLAFKAPVRVATTANITLAGEQTIDGVAVLGTGANMRPDRVLVKDQTDQTQNGVYDVSTGVWERAVDFDGNADIVTGTRVYVHSGTAGQGEYIVATADPIVIDTSNITFDVALGTPSLPTVDNAIVTFNGTSGALQSSSVTVDSGNVAGVVNLTQTGYTDLTEISEPSSPAANVLRIYAVDDGAGVSMLSAKDSSGNVLPITHFTQAGTGAVTRTAQAKQREFITIADFGGVGDDVTSNTTAIANARTAAGADRPVYLLSGDYNVSQTPSLYGTDFDDALGLQILVGTTASPATRHEPVLWIEKVSSSSRSVDTDAWDHGAFYGSLDKRSDSAFGAAVTGYALYTGGTGDLIGIHGRGRGTASGSQIFGMWAYADCAVSDPNRIVGMEIDVRNSGGTTPTWANDGASGDLSGLVIATADSTSPGISSHAIRITELTGGGFLTGIQIGSHAIVASDGSLNGEAIMINGAAVSGDRYGGIRLGFSGSTHFHYGLKLSEAAFNDDTAIWLGGTQRIRWSDIGSNFTGINQIATDFLGFFTDGTERVRISNAGGISMGTTIVSDRLNLGSVSSSDTPSNILRLIQLSDGTAVGAGRGVNIRAQVATQASNANLEIGGEIRCIATDVTAASEDFDWRFLLMTAGAGASEKLRISSSNMMQIWNGSALVQVSLGDAESGGGGFRLLRVPN